MALKNFLRILFFFLISSFFINCGYHLRGTGTALPPSIKKIYVPVFKNLTTRYELDLKLTQAVINELITRGKLELVGEAEKADALLLGEITSFQVAPLAFTGKDTADKYNITIVAKIIFRELRSQQVLFSHPAFVYVEEYEVPEGTDFESMEAEALARVAEKFARSLVVALLEGF
ncbi:MAG: LPS assembly lipoprotein LptE [Candidatus Aminicenantes bacterium]|nr:LPS assembly lipoprotein LptE [Candidatus Aminicenantes bacterium]